MQKNNTTKIEAQGGEIITRNSYGDVAIIPKNLVKKYQAYMKAACDECIDELVASLPAMSQYAADGSVIPQGKKVKVTLPDGEQAEYSTESVEYKNLYNSGKLANVVKDKVTGEDTYVMPALKEVEITAEKPKWMQHIEQYKKIHPKSEYVKQYLDNGIAKGLGNTETNYPTRLDEEYENKALDYAAKQLDFTKRDFYKGEIRSAHKYKAGANEFKKIEDKYSRVNYLNSLPDKQQEILSRLPKYQPGLWTDAVEGGAKLTESDPSGILVSKVMRYLNDGNFTEREKREAMKQYKDHPVISQIEAVGKLLGPLNIPYNATIGNLYTKTQGEENYTIGAALKGQKPKTESTMLAIGADPLNLFGLGLIDDLPKLGKAANVLSKERQITGSVDRMLLGETSTTINGILHEDDFLNIDKILAHIQGLNPKETEAVLAKVSKADPYVAELIKNKSTTINSTIIGSDFNNLAKIKEHIYRLSPGEYRKVERVFYGHGKSDILTQAYLSNQNEAELIKAGLKSTVKVPPKLKTPTPPTVVNTSTTANGTISGADFLDFDKVKAHMQGLTKNEVDKIAAKTYGWDEYEVLTKVYDDMFPYVAPKTYDVPVVDLDDWQLGDIMAKHKAEYEKLYGTTYTDKDLGLYAKLQELNNTVTYRNKVRSEEVQQKTEAFMAKHNISKDYTIEEDILTSAYTRGYDTRMNLRATEPNVDKELYARTINPKVEELIQRNKLAEPEDLYRGESDFRIANVWRNGKKLDVPIMKSELEIGDEWEPGSFVSTSTEHTGSFGGSINEVYEAPKGQSILYPNATKGSEFDHELEALLPSKLRFKVLSKDSSAGYATKYRHQITNPYMIALLAGAYSTVKSEKVSAKTLKEKLNKNKSK